MKFPTLKEFIKDPSCVDNGNFGDFWKNRREYDKRWEYVSKVFKTFDIHYFKENDYSYYIYIEVPSERRGNTYDIVIHFFTQFDAIASQSNLQNYNIKFFSNNPVFGFWFAYANASKGLIIDFLLDKIPRDMLENPAKKYNPKSHVGFDHSFYHAAKYLLDAPRRLNKTFFESKLLPFEKSRIHKLCRPLDQTMEEYRELKNKENNKKRFNEEKSLKDRASDTIADIKSGLQSGKDKISETINKIKNPGVKKITASKSNATNKTKSGVHRITARKGRRK